MGQSLLKAAGLSAWMQPDDEGAIAFLRENISSINRAAIRANIARSALCDADDLVRQFGDALLSSTSQRARPKGSEAG